MQLFMSYSWPGNVRELEHVIEGSINMVEKGNVIDVYSGPQCLNRIQSMFHFRSFVHSKSDYVSRPTGHI